MDAGERRVGVALSDPTRLLASPVTVLDRRKGLAPVLDSLVQLVQREGVSHMIVGLPLNADGSEGPQALRARDFARTAERVVGVSVEMWDERLSTRAAEDILRAQGRNLRRVRQRGEVDAIAAAAILQDWLDHGLTAHTSPRDSREEELKACPHEDVPGETSPTGPRDERPTESPETEDPGQTPGGKRYEPC